MAAAGVLSAACPMHLRLRHRANAVLLVVDLHLTPPVLLLRQRHMCRTSARNLLVVDHPIDHHHTHTAHGQTTSLGLSNLTQPCTESFATCPTLRPGIAAPELTCDPIASMNSTTRTTDLRLLMKKPITLPNKLGSMPSCLTLSCCPQPSPLCAVLSTPAMHSLPFTSFAATWPLG